MERLAPSLRRSVPAVAFAALLFTLTGCASAPAEAPRSSAATAVPADPQLDFGIDMARRGLWSEALFRFQKAAESQPSDPKILNNMAVAYEALGQFERALTYYQDALKAAPDNRDLRRNYSRFVEFYRAFKPDQQKDASLTAPASEGGGR